MEVFRAYVHDRIEPSGKVVTWLDVGETVTLDGIEYVRTHTLLQVRTERWRERRGDALVDAACRLREMAAGISQQAELMEHEALIGNKA